MNFASAQGVHLRGINLHSALIFPRDRIMRLSMGRSPAADYPYRGLQLTPTAVLPVPENAIEWP